VRAIIAGGGNVGRHLAVDLEERGHEVTLIEQDKRVLTKAQNAAPNVALVLGDACELWVLERAQIQSADVMVAATGDDEDNLVISLLAKQEYSVPRVLARVNHPKNVGDLVRILPLERGRVGLVELTLPEDSPIAGGPVYELRMPPDTAIVAILREGHIVIPQPETVLTGGDEIIALTAPESEDQLRQVVMGDTSPGSPYPENS